MLFYQGARDQKININGIYEDIEKNLQITESSVQRGDYNSSEEPSAFATASPASNNTPITPYLVFEYTSENEKYQSNLWLTNNQVFSQSSGRRSRTELVSIMLPSRFTISNMERAKWFSDLQKKKQIDGIIKSLKFIDDRLDSLFLGILRSEQVIYADIGEPQLIPLQIMGDGILRLLDILLAINQAENGFVLIDEVENGLHYSIQESIWRVISEASVKNNTQVFATTHSLECVVYAHEALNNNSGHFMVHRIDRVNNNLRTTSFDRDMLGAAIENRFEIR